MKYIFLLISFFASCGVVVAQDPNVFPLAPQITTFNWDIDSAIVTLYMPGRLNGIGSSKSWKISPDSLFKTAIRLCGGSVCSTCFNWSDTLPTPLTNLATRNFVLRTRPYITSTQIGFGSSANVLTSSPNIIYDSLDVAKTIFSIGVYDGNDGNDGQGDSIFNINLNGGSAGAFTSTWGDISGLIDNNYLKQDFVAGSLIMRENNIYTPLMTSGASNNKLLNVDNTGKWFTTFTGNGIKISNDSLHLNFNTNAPSILGKRASGLLVDTSITFTDSAHIAGTGISISRAANKVTITNTSPWSAVSGTTPINVSGNTISCSTCLTGNQTITLSGDVTGSGATAITTAIGTGKVKAGGAGDTSHINGWTNFSTQKYARSLADSIGGVAAAANTRLLVSSKTATNQATLSFTSADGFVSGYSYEVVVTNATSSTTGVEALMLRQGTGGTPTYQTTGYVYNQTFVQSGTTYPKYSGSAIGIPVIGIEGSTGSFTLINTTVKIPNPAQTAVNHTYTFYGENDIFISGGTYYNNGYGGGTVTSTTAATAVQFVLDNGGNFSGTFDLYRLPL